MSSEWINKMMSKLSLSALGKGKKVSSSLNIAYWHYTLCPGSQLQFQRENHLTRDQFPSLLDQNSDNDQAEQDQHSSAQRRGRRGRWGRAWGCHPSWLIQPSSNKEKFWICLVSVSHNSQFRKCVLYDEIEREFYCEDLGFRKACFIDHLEIKSTIIKRDSEEVIQRSCQLFLGLHLLNIWRAELNLPTMKRYGRRKRPRRAFQWASFSLWREELSPGTQWWGRWRSKLRDLQRRFSQGL